eukprot:Anaeramoba_flamelloidesc26267_g1_i1.p1 GENE.c26267_g1_i1~~c26267_g1_i1.p1  ORF type:complete len:259 (+),score=48.95 c26267_g1_i1:123-899(+)
MRERIRIGLKNEQINPDSLKQYYGYLMKFEKIFPLNVHHPKSLKIEFSWRCSVTKKRGKDRSINFEKVSVLFNLCSIYCKKIYFCDLKEEEGIKEAISYSKLVATLFKHIKEKISQKFLKKPTDDLSDNTLLCFENLNFAQQHELIMYYALKLGYSAKVISRIAMKASSLYHQTIKNLMDSKKIKSQLSKVNCHFNFFFVTYQKKQLKDPFRKSFFRDHEREVPLFILVFTLYLSFVPNKRFVECEFVLKQFFFLIYF